MRRRAGCDSRFKRGFSAFDLAFCAHCNRGIGERCDEDEEDEGGDDYDEPDSYVANRSEAPRDSRQDVD